MDFGSLNFGQLSTDRSFVIVNHATMPFEFTITSNQDVDDPSDLAFSLSRTFVKLFRGVTIEASGSLRVYVHFRPQSRKQATRKAVEEKSVEIYVRCRLLKDFQKVIVLKATCVPPSIDMSPHANALFEAQARPLADQQTSDDPSNTITVAVPEMNVNVFLCPAAVVIPVRCLSSTSLWVCNDSRLFHVRAAVKDEGTGVDLIISVHLDVLQRNLKQIRKDKFIEEHISVYNAIDPNEWFHIPLRLTFGTLHPYVMSSYGRSTTTFNTLEELVLLLIRDCRSFHPPGSFALRPRVSPGWVVAQQKGTNERRLHVVDPIEVTLYLRYVYIANELVYFSLREYAGEAHRQLAILLFRSLLDQPAFTDEKERTSLVNIFSPSLRSQSDESESSSTFNIDTNAIDCWIRPLRMYLSYFTGTHPVLDTLVDLRSRLPSLASGRL